MDNPRQESTPKSIGSFTRNALFLNGMLNKLPGEKPTEEKLTAPEFVHPIFTRQDFANTLQNYNQHIKKYNLKLWIENAGVRKYNKAVIRARKGASIPMEQKVREQIWKETNKDLSAEAYNEAVEAYNLENGLQLRKKSLSQPVKPDSEKYFQAFLYQYNSQLFRRKACRAQLDVYVPGELPQFDLYPNKIIEVERNGVRNLPVSVETIRHHRERLEEAGVFTHSLYRGATRAVKMTFNASILSITDNGLPKNTATDNQLLTRERTNKVPHNNVSSREHVLKKDKVREEGVVTPEKGAPTNFNGTGTSTKTPKRQDGKKPDPLNNPDADYRKKINQAANSDTKNEVSELLATRIQEKKDLVRGLSAGDFDKYQRVPEKMAMQEAFRGALHPDDYKELAIQDIFRFAAIIFTALNVHPGSWMNAYKLWLNEKFKSPNGYTLNKANIYSQWMHYIEILKEVRKFTKNHPEWQPHYPSQYFDPARKFKENNSFEYASRHFRLGEKETNTAQQRRIKAGKSLKIKTDVKKAQEQIKRMISGKISLDQLFDYVQQNCDKQVQKNLDKLVKREMKNKNTNA